MSLAELARVWSARREAPVAPLPNQFAAKIGEMSLPKVHKKANRRHTKRLYSFPPFSGPFSSNAQILRGPAITKTPSAISKFPPLIPRAANSIG